MVAQTGRYQYQNKSTGTAIGLNLRADGVFFYEYEKGWTHCITQGKWRPLGSGRVLLTSDHQLSDYTLEEVEDTTVKGIQIILQGAGKGQSPTAINSFYLNENETAQFQPDGEASMRLLQTRQRIMTAGTAAERDSLKNTDPPRHYVYDMPIQARSITLVFDNQEVLIPIKNNKATRFILTTRFAPQSGYKYLSEQTFIKQGDFIREEGSAVKMKKQKR